MDEKKLINIYDKVPDNVLLNILNKVTVNSRNEYRIDKCTIVYKVLKENKLNFDDIITEVKQNIDGIVIASKNILTIILKILQKCNEELALDMYRRIFLQRGSYILLKIVNGNVNNDKSDIHVDITSVAYYVNEWYDNNASYTKWKNIAVMIGFTVACIFLMNKSTVSF